MSAVSGPMTMGRWPGVRRLPVHGAGLDESIQLWMLNSEELAVSAAYARCLSHEEQRRADRFRFAAHRQRFIAARATLRHLLADQLAWGPERIRFVYGPAGRPEVAWPPTRIRFSLSHSRSATLIALARDNPVGIDLEWLDQEIDPLSFGATFFSADELQQLERCNAHEQSRLFFRLWTAKEAVLKMLGAGFSLDPSAIRAADALARGTPVRMPAMNSDIRLVELELAPLYAATLAIGTAGIGA